MKELNMFSKKISFKNLNYFSITVGLVTVIIQFWLNRSLWLDESMIAINILQKDAFELLYPLDYNQVAPIFFLEIEKFFSDLIPNTEYGLRIFPLICYVLSIFFYSKILIILFKINGNKYVFFGLTFFLFNTMLIYYSSEVKQYIVDVFCVLTLYYFYLKNYKNSNNKNYFIVTSGTISIFLSNVTPIFLFSIGLCMLCDLITKKEKKIYPIVIVYAFWLTTFIFFYYYFIYDHPTKDAMILFWQGSSAFLPNNPMNKEFYIFLIFKSKMIFFTLLPYGYLGFVFLPLLYIFGIKKLLNSKNYIILILTGLPLFIHLILSSFKLYPFSQRLLLYNIPLLLIIITYGYNYFIEKNNKLLNYTKSISFFLLAFCLINLMLSKFPYEKEEIKKSINYIEKNISIEDKIYIYYRAIPAYRYYKEIGEAKIKRKVFLGKLPKKNEFKYLKDINKMKGRVWLLFSHSHENEKEIIIDFINSKGGIKIKQFETIDSSAYLYDLK
jgi:hypothetical protein